MMPPAITVAPAGAISGKADKSDFTTRPEVAAAVVQQAHRAGAAIAHLRVRDTQDRPAADMGIARRGTGLRAIRAAVTRFATWLPLHRCHSSRSHDRWVPHLRSGGAREFD